MITIRKAQDRGATNIGWLDSRHSFSFGDYYDPRNMGIGPLRVINDDRVTPGAGFATHGHRDMEIISYVLEGGLEHKDSLGTGSVIRPGEVQRMSAGTGVRHSEYNASGTDPVRFLQIWILPEKDGLEPSYEQKPFSAEERRGRLRLVGSRDGRDGSVTIHQDADMYVGSFTAGERTDFPVRPGRGVWAHVARGSAEIAGRSLSEGDALSARDVEAIAIEGREDAEIVLFDLAA
ncbi:MAG: pirin family protein [Caulobacterales bacterium]|nr:pirin family protein [Caulobacterales bacterium]